MEFDSKSVKFIIDMSLKDSLKENNSDKNIYFYLL